MPYICINSIPQTTSWIDLIIVRKTLIMLYKKIGILKILQKIFEENIPKIAPKIILTNQLKKPINIVSFNRLITVIIISLSILGLNAEIKNSWNNLNPPKWILFTNYTLEVCIPKLEEKIMRYSLILIYSTN